MDTLMSSEMPPRSPVTSATAISPVAPVSTARMRPLMRSRTESEDRLAHDLGAKLGGAESQGEGKEGAAEREGYRRLRKVRKSPTAAPTSARARRGSGSV